MTMTVRSRLLVAFLPVLLIALLGLGASSYVFVRGSLTAATLAQLESVASIQQDRVEQELQRRVERLGLISSRTQMRISLRKLAQQDSEQDRNRLRRIIADAKNSLPDVMSISLLNLQGLVVASTAAELEGKDFSDYEAFKLGKETERVDLVRRSVEGLIGTLAAPLQLDGETVGVVVVESSVEGLISVVSNYNGLGKTGETVLARRSSNGDAEFLLPLRFDQDAALKRTVSKQALEVPMVQALRKQELVMSDAINYRGHAVLAVTRYLPGPDWGLVVIQEQAEAYLPWSRLRIVIIALAVVVGILALKVGVYTSRGLTEPLRELVHKAEAIRMHAPEDGGSELALTQGYLEVEKLSHAFSVMTRELMQRNTTLKGALSELEDTVAAKTQALNELERAQALLLESERLAALGETVSGMAHEVNTPLGVAVTAASTLMRTLEDMAQSAQEPEVVERVQFALEATNLVERNVNRAADLMVSYKTVAVDQASEARREFDIRAYIDDVLLNLRPQLKRLPHQIEVSGAEELMYYGIPGALSQILTNLILNAVIHAFPDGQQGLVQIDLQCIDDQIHLSCRDNGRGIEKADQERVFEQFFTTRRGEGGSGVGLHLVRKLTEEQLEGHIQLDSTAGQGSSFLIEFPMRRRA